MHERKFLPVLDCKIYNFLNKFKLFDLNSFINYNKNKKMTCHYLLWIYTNIYIRAMHGIFKRK